MSCATSLQGQNGITTIRSYASCTWRIDGHHIQGEGAPASPPPDTLNQPWIYDNVTTGETYHWDVSAQAWFLVGGGAAVGDDDFRIQGNPAATFGAGTVNDGAWRNGPIIIGADTPRSANVALDIQPDAGNVQEAQVLFTGLFNSTPASPIEGLAATAFMWLPEAAALRAGRDTDTVSFSNANIGDYSFAFGLDVKAPGQNSIALGFENESLSNFSSVTGGGTNTIQSTSPSSFIGGGQQNDIQTGSFNFIGGGQSNVIIEGSGSVIVGGLGNSINGPEDFFTATAFIGGGSSNVINSSPGTNGGFIVGGSSNNITGQTFHNFIGAGNSNSIIGNTIYAAIIAGGNNQIIQADNSFIGSGAVNIINSGADYSAIIGGEDNQILPVARNSVIPGGRQARANNPGQLIMSSGRLNVSGDSQWAIANLKIETIDAAPTDLVIDPFVAPTGIDLGSDAIYGVSGNLVARNPATGDVSNWLIQATIKTVAGVASIVGAPGIILQAQDAGAAAWAVVFVVSGSTFTLRVTGVAATTIRWNAAFILCEVI